MKKILLIAIVVLSCCAALAGGLWYALGVFSVSLNITYQNSEDFRSIDQREDIGETMQVALDYSATSEDLMYMAGLPPGPDYMLMDCSKLRASDFARAFGRPMPLLSYSMYFEAYRGGAEAIGVVLRSGVCKNIHLERCNFTSYQPNQFAGGGVDVDPRKQEPKSVVIHESDGVAFVAAALADLEDTGVKLEVSIQQSPVSSDALWTLLRFDHIVSLKASPQNHVDHEALRAYAKEHGKKLFIRTIEETKPSSQR